ncbi:MAG: TonB-dependent receptor [Opitutae bacterium]
MGVTSALANAVLEPMVVVESRTPTPMSQASPWVTRISAQDLDEKQVYNLADALRSVPGMAVVRTGQMGAQTSLFSRGAQSDHVTFLYEGRRLNGGFSGTYNLGQLSLNGVSSVEVLRGPSSVQYGAEGIGGAVMLRSRPHSEGLNWEMESGSNQSILNRVDYGFRESGWEGNVGTFLFTTENEQPYSGFDNQSASFHLARRVSKNLQFDVFGTGSGSDLYYPGNNKSPAYPVPGQFQEIEGFLLSPGAKLQVGEWDISAFYSYSEDHLTGKDRFSDTTYDTQTDAFDLQLNGELWKGWQVTIGGLYERDTFFKIDNSSSLVDINKKAESGSLFLLTTYSFEQSSSLSLGFRYDHFSDYGSASNGSFLYEKEVWEGISLVSRYSTCFSPPQANDLYGMWGNPALESEKAKSWEVGILAQPNPMLNLRLSYFETDFEDLIEWSGMTTSNVGAARSRGLESSLEGMHENYSCKVSFSYLEAENSMTHERLLRRPKMLGEFTLQRADEISTIGMGVRVSYDVIDLDGATWRRTKGDDFTVFRFYGNYYINDEIKLFGRIENLWDQDYEEVDGYQALGRTLHAGMAFSF